MNMTNEQSRDIVAKLLAEENISIIRSNVRTASFDTNARVLSLPIWKDTTSDTEEMLIAHEVGHALFTPKLEREQFSDVPFGYMNVIEDVRIEKLMKRRFPGLRRIMFMGYKQLNDKDFFGIKNRDLSKLRLIDRINLWYKAGVNSGVKFSEEERDFLYRAEHTESFDEVMALAVDVFNYQKAQNEKRKQMLDEIFKDDLTLESSEDLSFDEDYEYDEDGFEDEEDDDTFKSESTNEDETEEEMAGDDYINPMQPLEHQSFDQQEAQDAENQVETMDNFNQRLDELADSDTVYQYIDLAYCKEYNPIIGYKKILKEIRIFEPGSFHSKHDLERTPLFTAQEYVQFRAESMRVVNYLVKEFEMRKSAKQYKRATQSKTGMLDPAKLFGYKISEDLFKRITVVPGGKNHGMVFLLDWSGSMHECIFDTVKQVINLAMFCHRVQIPFHVFAFSSGTSKLGQDEAMVKKFHEWTKMQYEARYNRQEFDPKQSSYETFTLLEFFNHRMNATEFNTMAKCLMSFLKYTTNYYSTWNDEHLITYDESRARSVVADALSLGATPLNESLVYMVEEFVPKFIKQNSIEKFTFMTLSDGDGHNIVDTNRFFYETKADGTGKRRKIVSFLRDSVTKVNHRLKTGESSEVTSILNQMLSDRYNATTIGFYITSSRRRDIQYAVQKNCPDAWGTEDAIRTNMRKEGVACLKAAGRDEFFLMLANRTAIVDDEIKVDSSMNSRAAAKAMTQFFNQQKTSRVLLNRFVGLTA